MKSSTLRLTFGITFISALITAIGCAGLISPDQTSSSPMQDRPVPPYRNMEISFVVNMHLAYSAADQNAAPVELQRYTDAFRAKMNELGRADGNSFPWKDLVDPANCLFLDINIYTNDAPTPYTTWSFSGELRNGRNHLVHVFRTRGYENTGDAITDMASQVYDWIHSGWN